MFKMEIKAKFEGGEFNPLTEIKGVREGEIVELILKKSRINLKFIGMWKDRGDIKDGISYVNKVRSWKR